MILGLHWCERAAQITARIAINSARDDAIAHYTACEFPRTVGGLISALRFDPTAHRENVASCDLTNRNLADVLIQPVIEQPFSFR
jgi:hypothetical protein